MPGLFDSAISFVTTSATKKITEAANSVVSTFGNSIAGFTKITSNAPTIDQLEANAVLKSGNFNAIDRATSAVAAAGLAGQVSASTVKSTMAKKVTNEHKVSLTSTADNDQVEFEVMPEITETHTVAYEAVAPAQFPGSFQKFKNRDSTAWTINITLISRNTAEATKNYQLLRKLRGWTMPYYGAGTLATTAYKSLFGAPPAVLLLRGMRNLIGPVPVVITNISVVWPRDVDYLPTSLEGSDGNYIPFPVVINVPVQMVESYSIDQFNNFSLGDYKIGYLDLAFSTSPSQAKTSAPSQTVGAAEPVQQPDTTATLDTGSLARADRAANVSSAVTNGAVQLPLRLAADSRNAREEGIKLLKAAVPSANINNVIRPR